MAVKDSAKPLRHKVLARVRSTLEKPTVPFQLTLQVFAAQKTTMDQLRHVPADVWINLAICVVAVVAMVRLWRVLKHINDYAPYFAVLLVGSGIFCYWVYERTEPAFLTPLVEHLAQFLPSKGVQEAHLDKIRKSRE